MHAELPEGSSEGLHAETNDVQQCCSERYKGDSNTVVDCD
jgi:hypothetical protein